MGEKLDQLRSEIPMNVDVQRFFDGLDEGDREQLADLIGDAVARQETRIDEAGEQALRLVPRAFRGPVKKLLFGDHD